MHNPYLEKTRNISVGIILRRMLGQPKRFLLTIGLVLIPLLFTLAGGADFLQSWLYASSHKGARDSREAVFFVTCLEQKGRCGAGQKPRYWPIEKVEVGPLAAELSQPDPLLLGGLFCIAFLAFAALTSPRFDRRNQQNTTGLVPPEEADPDHNWLVGGLVRREWKADPGYFRLLKSGSTTPYFLTTEMLRTNLLLVAPPGSGKTTSIIRPFIDFARKRGNCALLVFDAKSRDFEPALFDYNFDLSDYAHSFKLVLYGGRTPAQAGEQLGEALIPNLNEEKSYFSDVAKNSMATLVEAHHTVTGAYPELIKLLVYLKNPDKLQDLIEEIGQQVKNPNVAERLIANVQSVIDLGQMKGDLLGNLRLALQPLTNPEISRFLIAQAREGETAFSVWELLNRPGLIRLALPVAEYPKVAAIIGRLFLSQFNYTVLSAQVNQSIFKAAAVDEAHNFVSTSIGKGMAQARSNNAGYILSFQTLAQIEEKTLRDTIFAASGTKVVLAGVGDEDAEKFSKTFGELEMPYISRNTSSSSSTSNNSGSSFSKEGGGSSSSSSNSRSRNSGQNFSTRLRRHYLPSEIRELPRYHALIESSDARGQRWFAQLIDMSEPTVNRLSKAQEQKGGNRFKLRAAKQLKDKATESFPVLPQESLTALPQLTSNSEAYRPAYFSLSNLTSHVESSNQGVLEVSWQMAAPTSGLVTPEPNLTTKIPPLTGWAIPNLAKPPVDQAEPVYLWAEKQLTTRALNEDVSNDGNWTNAGNGSNESKGGSESDGGKGEQLVYQQEFATNLAEEQTDLTAIKHLLKTEGDLGPEKVETLTQLVLDKGCTLEDLKRLVLYASLISNPKQRGSYIARLIQSGDYPDEAKIARARAKLTEGK